MVDTITRQSVDWLRPEDIDNFVAAARANLAISGQVVFGLRVQLLAHMPWIHWDDIDEAVEVIMNLARAEVQP